MKLSHTGLCAAMHMGGNVETLQLKRTVTPELCKISDDITTMIIITAIAVILMVAVFHFTKFGYDYRALQTGQKISVSTGINEVKNAVGCYTVAGAASRRCRHSQLFIC